MSAIDEFSIKQDYTSATLRVSRGRCSPAGNVKGLSLRFAHQTSRRIRRCHRWQVTPSERVTANAAAKVRGNRNATSEEREDQTQFPVFHECDNEIVRHPALNTLVICLGRNDMPNLTRVKVYVNSAVRKGSP